MIYSGSNELLCRLFDEASISISKDHVGIGFITLNSNRIFYVTKINLKSNLRIIHGMMTEK